MRKVASFFFLATLFCCTFEKVHWNFGGQLALSDILALCFIVAYVVISRPNVPRTSAMLLGFGIVFVVVYLCGFYNLNTAAGLDQFAKGFAKFVIHFVFLALAVAWLARRGIGYYWRALAWFFGGMAVNAAYGVAQLAFAQAGVNLDSLLVSPLTGGASQINIYGAINGSDVYRPNALTGDPNHLGIMLIVPLLVLTPLYLRMEPTHRLRRKLGGLLAFLVVVEIATLSRSGVLGIAVGALILLLPYRGYLRSRAFVYPLLGHGLNNFSLYYQAATGKTNWGPHSFYVSLIVETGLVGTVLFALFLFWVFVRLKVARELGNRLGRAGNPLARRVRPLAWGWTAALAGTLAANFFYLTMSFYYFFVFLALALAVPLVFGPAVEAVPVRVRRPRRPAPMPEPAAA